MTRCFLDTCDTNINMKKPHNVDGLSVSLGLLNDRVQGLARL